MIDGATIRFDLARGGLARLVVVEPSGRRIRSLDVTSSVPGAQALYWDGRDDRGQLVPAGVYYYVLTADSIRESRRLIVVR
jgi:hypothetical protein